MKLENIMGNCNSKINAWKMILLFNWAKHCHHSTK